MDNKTTLKKLGSEMIRLERKLHGEGSLSDEEHSHIQDLHALHGAGFFDSIKGWLWKNVHPLGRMIEHTKKAYAQRHG